MVIEFRPLAGCARPAIPHAGMGGPRSEIRACGFIGSVEALNQQTGELAWKTELGEPA